MKKRIVIIVVLLALLLFAALIRFTQVGITGGGRSEDSPNKTFNAEAGSFWGQSFWGRKLKYYEFTVSSSRGQRLYHVLMDEISGDMIDWREDGTIEWAKDNSSVTFSCKGIRLELPLKP